MRGDSAARENFPRCGKSVGCYLFDAPEDAVLGAVERVVETDERSKVAVRGVVSHAGTESIQQASPEPCVDGLVDDLAEDVVTEFLHGCVERWRGEPPLPVDLPDYRRELGPGRVVHARQPDERW